MFSFLKKFVNWECLGWSEKRGSNPRPQPWQGCALPAELFSLFPRRNLILFYQKTDSQSFFGNLGNLHFKAMSKCMIFAQKVGLTEMIKLERFPCNIRQSKFSNYLKNQSLDFSEITKC